MRRSFMQCEIADARGAYVCVPTYLTYLQPTYPAYPFRLRTLPTLRRTLPTFVAFFKATSGSSYHTPNRDSSPSFRPSMLYSVHSIASSSENAYRCIHTRTSSQYSYVMYPSLRTLWIALSKCFAGSMRMYWDIPYAYLPSPALATWQPSRQPF